MLSVVALLMAGVLADTAEVLEVVAIPRPLLRNLWATVLRQAPEVLGAVVSEVVSTEEDSVEAVADLVVAATDVLLEVDGEARPVEDGADLLVADMVVDLVMISPLLILCDLRSNPQSFHLM